MCELNSWLHTPPWRGPTENLSLPSRPLLGTNGQTIETKPETKLLYAQNMRCRSICLALNRIHDYVAL
jgi:hypothetical protein